MGRRSVDPLPPVALWGDDAPQDPPQRVEVGSRKSRRTPVLIAAGLVVALVGGLALGDDTSRSARVGKDERDNATRVPLKSTTTTQPRPTTTTTAPPPPVPILPGSGAQLVLSGGGGGPELLDLETGIATQIVSAVRGEVYGLVPVRGGIVVVEGGNAKYLPLPEGAAVFLGRADQVLSSGDPEAVWLVVPSEDPYRQISHAQLVSLSGEPLRGRLGIDTGYIAGAYSGGVIAPAGGRIYAIDAPGTIRAVVAGEVIGVSEQRLLARTCDDHAVCALMVWDANLENPQVVDAPESASMYYGSTVVVEPGGTRAALLSYGPSGADLVIVDLAGGPAQPVDLVGDVSGLAWLPGDLGLVVAQQTRLVRVHFEGSQAVNEVLRDRGADFVAVIR